MNKDIFGNVVAIGDTVAFNPPKYKGLVVGTVLKLTPKGFTVEYTATGKNEGKDQTNVPQVVKRIEGRLAADPIYDDA